MNAELAKKLKKRQEVIAADGETWETEAGESVADARGGEWMFVESNQDIFEISPNEKKPASGPQSKVTSPVRLDLEPAIKEGVVKRASQNLNFAPADRPEPAERERTRLATECATRWAKVLKAAPPPEQTADSPTTISEADKRTILADVQRTRGSDPAFKEQPEMHKRLENLLTNFCVQEGVGYTQGLHEVAAVFAFLQSAAPANADFNDAAMLSCFVAFVQKFMPYFHEGEAFVALHISLLFFRQLILYHHPDLHNQLEDAGVSPFVYATPWFITLFAARTPLTVLLRLWDRYIERDDSSFLPFLAVAMLVGEKSSIIAAGKDEAHSAVGKAGIKTMRQLDEVWAKAEALHAQTPRSFTMRLSKVLEAVKKKQGVPQLEAETPWSDRVLTQVERERRFVVRPEEVAAYCVRLWRMTEGKSADGAQAKTDEGSTAAASPTANGTGESDVVVVQPDPALPKLRFMLLDLRPKEEHQADVLPMALHFHPSCLRKLVASASGKPPRLERLAATLSAAVGSLMGGSGGHDGESGAAAAADGSDPGSGGGGASAGAGGMGPATGAGHNVGKDEQVLVTEVFEALREAAAERWGEDWLSESAKMHLVLLGGAADAHDLVGKSEGAAGMGAVAPMYEALTEHLSLARVSVVLGGVGAVNREAAKRGYDLSKTMRSEHFSESVQASLGGLFNSAWSRLQAASESMPEPEAARGRLTGVFAGGFEGLKKFAGNASLGLQEGAAVVRQHAAEGASVVRQQAGHSMSAVSAVWQHIEKLDREATSKDVKAAVTGSWVCEAHYAVQVPLEGGEEGETRTERRILQDAFLRLNEDGELLLLRADIPVDQAEEGTSPTETDEMCCAYAAEGLQKVGTSQAQPCMLGFYFPGPIGSAAAAEVKEVGAPPPQGARPAIVAKFLSPEEAKDCGRAVAATAVRRRKAAKAAAASSSAETTPAKEASAEAPAAAAEAAAAAATSGEAPATAAASDDAEGATEGAAAKECE